MQTTTAAQATPIPLIFARHLIGMGIVALANPLIYYSDQPAFSWLETWATPIVLALVAYGLYALFLTKRAKAAWPKSFFILAWVLLTMLVAGPWIDKFRSAQSAAKAQQPAPAFDPSTARPVEAPTAVAMEPQPTQEQIHDQTILRAHPDAFQIAQTQPFQTWLKANPAYQKISTSGTADEVIRMLTIYKATPPPPPSRSAKAPEITAPSKDTERAMQNLNDWSNRHWNDLQSKGR